MIFLTNTNTLVLVNSICLSLLIHLDPILNQDRFLPIPNLFNFEDFNFTDTDFDNWMTYRYWFFITKK